MNSHPLKRKEPSTSEVEGSQPLKSGSILTKGPQKSNELLDAALWYAEQGFSIFPTGFDKKPLLKWIKYQKERATPDQIREWWVKFPDANIGIVTGSISGLAVIDADDPEALEWCEENLPTTPTVETARGRHYYFKFKDGLKNTVKVNGLKLDIRAEGGYVVAPPSIHESGVVYSWLDGRSFDDLPLADFPTELFKQQDTAHPSTTTTGKAWNYGQAALISALSKLAGATEGTRNSALNEAAFSLGQLVAGGELDRGAVVAALTGTALSIGLKQAEAHATINSGLEAGAREPRTAPESGRREPLSTTTEVKQLPTVELEAIKAGPEWPEPNPAIYHGLSGEIVRAIEPHTEADPVALQVQTLVTFGNMIGRGAWLEIEADRHYTNEFIALVGESSKARKGTSLSHIIRLSETVDPEWERERVQNGLSSAEGAIYAVRDEVRKGDTIIDEGVADKRLMLIEPELASVLKVASREGNTLSAMLRQSWDGRTLRTLTKNSPLKALNSLISLISHVTKEELLRYLTSTEAGNGFANRFLWVAVRRSKCLPRGGQITKVNFQPLLKKLKAAVHFAKDAGLVEPTEETWLIWERVYPELSEGKPGLLGAVTSRAEAHVMRLALIYTLMDSSNKIKPEHLLAALALWDYCNESAQYIFGDSSGNPIADEILTALKSNPEGLTRTDISNIFGRHKQKGEIAQSLIYLLGKGSIAKTQIETGGRSSELWVAKKAN